MKDLIPTIIDLASISNQLFQVRIPVKEIDRKRRKNWGQKMTDTSKSCRKT
jgi:hypothetical protein